MQINLIGKDLEIDSKMKELVREKIEPELDEILKNFAQDVKTAEIGVSFVKDKDLFELNFNMWLPGKKHVYAEAEDKKLQNAIVDLREKAVAQIKTYNGQLEEE
jgi:ribosome-associated translation inhibitor RaiA